MYVVRVPWSRNKKSPGSLQCTFIVGLGRLRRAQSYPVVHKGGEVSYFVRMCTFVVPTNDAISRWQIWQSLTNITRLTNATRVSNDKFHN